MKFKLWLENTDDDFKGKKTATLYHHTTKKAAEEIIKTLTLKGKEQNVFLTNTTDDIGFGDGTIVKIVVPVKDLELDDEFPNGRKDYRLPRKIYKLLKAELVKP
jgi:hypothetical protein